MTIDNELTTASINSLSVGSDAGKPVLLVGLKEGYRDKPQYVRSLKREFSQCKDFDHPHILKYVRLEEDTPNGACIVMEWEDSRTLGDYLRESHTEEEKKAIVVQIAEAVGYLHSNGFVHGALSASSVFVTRKGNQVKVLNFRPRYADNLKVPQDVTRYLAPEAKDGTVALDARADIFSLGVIVKEMNMGPEYNGVVDGCCSYGRYQRYENTEAFLSALERRRYSHTASGSATETERGNRSKFIIGAVVALVIVAVIVFFNSRSQTPSESRQPTASEQTDSMQQQSASAPSEASTADQRDTTTETQPQNTADNVPPADVDFLATMEPQMEKDIDKIFAPYENRELSAEERAQLSRHISRYYRGLRRTLKGKTPDEMAAFDKAFGDYVTSKKAALQ